MNGPKAVSNLSSGLRGASAAAYPVSPGRAQNRRAEIESRQHSWLRLDAQWPTSSENPQKVIPLCSLHTGELHLNFDPKLNDWITYKPEKAKAGLVEKGVSVDPSPGPSPGVEVKVS